MVDREINIKIDVSTLKGAARQVNTLSKAVGRLKDNIDGLNISISTFTGKSSEFSKTIVDVTNSIPNKGTGGRKQKSAEDEIKSLKLAVEKGIFQRITQESKQGHIRIPKTSPELSKEIQERAMREGLPESAALEVVSDIESLIKKYETQKGVKSTLPQKTVIDKLRDNIRKEYTVETKPDDSLRTMQSLWSPRPTSSFDELDNMMKAALSREGKSQKQQAQIDTIKKQRKRFTKLKEESDKLNSKRAWYLREVKNNPAFSGQYKDVVLSEEELNAPPVPTTPGISAQTIGGGVPTGGAKSKSTNIFSTLFPEEQMGFSGYKPLQPNIPSNIINLTEQELSDFTNKTGKWAIPKISSQMVGLNLGEKPEVIQEKPKVIGKPKLVNKPPMFTDLDWGKSLSGNIPKVTLSKINEYINKINPEIKKLAQIKDLVVESLVTGSGKYSAEPGKISIPFGTTPDELSEIETQHEFIHATGIDKIFSDAVSNKFGTPTSALTEIQKILPHNKNMLMDLIGNIKENYAGRDDKDEATLRDIAATFLAGYDESRSKWALNVRSILEYMVPDSKNRLPTPSSLEPIFDIISKYTGISSEHVEPHKSKPIDLNTLFSPKKTPAKLTTAHMAWKLPVIHGEEDEIAKVWEQLRKKLGTSARVVIDPVKVTEEMGELGPLAAQMTVKASGPGTEKFKKSMGTKIWKEFYKIVSKSPVSYESGGMPWGGAEHGRHAPPSEAELEEKEQREEERRIAKEVSDSAKVLRTRRSLFRSKQKEQSDVISWLGSKSTTKGIEEEVKARISDAGLRIDKKGVISNAPTTMWDRVKEMAGGGEGIGKTIDSLVTKGGALGRLSWTFTSLAMSSLGVYFSLIGVTTMLQRGINTVLGPLGNLQSLIEGLAWNQKEFGGTTLDLMDLMKKLGIDIGDVAEQSLYLKSVMGTVTGMLGIFGTMLLLDPDIKSTITGILQDLENFLFVVDKADPNKKIIKPELLSVAKDIFVGIREALPSILNGIVLLGTLIQRYILPHVGALAKMWAYSIIAMPIFSAASAIGNVGKALLMVVDVAGKVGGAFKYIFAGEAVAGAATATVTLSGMIVPIAAIIVLSALFYKAWQSDLNGIRSVTTEVVSSLAKTFGELAKSILSLVDGMLDLVISIQQITGAFTGLLNVIHIGDVLLTIVAIFNDLAIAIYEVCDGLNAMIDLINAISPIDIDKKLEPSGYGKWVRNYIANQDKYFETRKKEGTASPVKRASGGPLKAGQVALVGEEGPEIIVSKGDAEVIPNKDIRKLASGTGGLITSALGDMWKILNSTDKNTDSLDKNTYAINNSKWSKGATYEGVLGNIAYSGGPSAEAMKIPRAITASDALGKRSIPVSTSLTHKWGSAEEEGESGMGSTPLLSGILGAGIIDASIAGLLGRKPILPQALRAMTGAAKKPLTWIGSKLTGAKAAQTAGGLSETMIPSATPEYTFSGVSSASGVTSSTAGKGLLSKLFGSMILSPEMFPAVEQYRKTTEGNQYVPPTGYDIGPFKNTRLGPAGDIIANAMGLRSKPSEESASLLTTIPRALYNLFKPLQIGGAQAAGIEGGVDLRGVVDKSDETIKENKVDTREITRKLSEGTGLSNTIHGTLREILTEIKKGSSGGRGLSTSMFNVNPPETGGPHRDKKPPISGGRFYPNAEDVDMRYLNGGDVVEDRVVSPPYVNSSSYTPEVPPNGTPEDLFPYTSSVMPNGIPEPSYGEQSGFTPEDLFPYQSTVMPNGIPEPSAGEQYGFTPEDLFNLPGLAEGGIIKKTGAFMGHAGEIIASSSMISKLIMSLLSTIMSTGGAWSVPTMAARTMVNTATSGKAGFSGFGHYTKQSAGNVGGSASSGESPRPAVTEGLDEIPEKEVIPTNIPNTLAPLLQNGKWSNTMIEGYYWYTDATGTSFKATKPGEEGKNTIPSGAVSPGGIPKLDVGGMIQKSGMIQAHAGEVVSPISKITDLINSVASQKMNSDTTTTNNSPINITINISGNASKEVTDDMVRKMKKELFGRGIY